jgi:hypothetical protein
MTSSDSKIEKIQTHFKALSSVAPTLNAASDELTQAVAVLDENLKKLNVGLNAWVTFRSRAAHPSLSDEEYDVDQIGYGKVDGKWGIALRHIWGNYALEEFGGEGPWLFNDAPRELRLLGVDKIPELIEALGKEASETTKKVRETTKQVHDLAAAVAEVTNEPQTAVVVGTGELPVAQREYIKTRVRIKQKFLGEILDQASRWELRGSELRICFLAEKQPFAEMLKGRDSLAKLTGIVKEYLGDTFKVVVNTEPSTIVDSATSKGKGGK